MKYIENLFTMKLRRTTLLFILSAVMIMSCNQNEPNTTGTLNGVIQDVNTLVAIEGVRVALFDASTNEVVGNVLTTGPGGSFSFKVPQGLYTLKLSAQGYKEVPIRGSAAAAIFISRESTLDYTIQMFPDTNTNTGWISGKLDLFGISKLGVLVVATYGGTGYAGYADFEGNYEIHNVPAGTQSYLVRAFKLGVNTSDAGAVITANTGTEQVNLQLTATDGATISGSVQIPLSSNSEVDVILTHPDINEPIPGLSTSTTGGSYVLENVPNGVFRASASWLNDGLVMNPQLFVQNGDPILNVTGNPITNNFDLVPAVELVDPTNDSSERIPVTTGGTPTFSWNPYTGADDYVIEVSDAYGNLIWGGFGINYNTKNIVILSPETSIAFNSDGNAAIASLESGKVYRWRIYACKDNVESPTGFDLLSMSEDYMGLIYIQ